MSKAIIAIAMTVVIIESMMAAVKANAQGMKPPVMSVNIGGAQYAAPQAVIPGIPGDIWRCPGPCAGSVVVVIITDHGPFRRVVVAVSNARAVGGAGGVNILQGLLDVKEENFNYAAPYAGAMMYIGGLGGDCPLPMFSTFKLN